MPEHNNNINRSFHLGRRDVFYETAVEIMRRCVKETTARHLARGLDNALYCLHSALEHAFLAHKARHAPAAEKLFINFLEMLLARLQAGRFMLQSNTHWLSGNSPVRQFLGDQARMLARPIAASQTPIPDMFRDALAFTRAAAKPLQDLQELCMKKFSEEDRSRYEKAAASLREHLAETADQPRPKMFGQSVYPTHETTSE